MNSVLAVYDIPENLKIRNPSGTLRRYGFRVNLSCWVFPAGNVPTDVLESLSIQGATVHVVEFAEQAQEKVLELARQELKKHCKKLVEYVEKKCASLRLLLNALDGMREGGIFPNDEIMKQLSKFEGD